MIKYTFNVNEEIARWVTEVYVKNQQKLGWWVAFTNPIAGPWKKITALNGEGVPVEIYRFEREGERPDLILVNDKYKLIVIVEAKDYYQKLIASEQMKKSVRVIKEISSILVNSSNEHWAIRIGYKILPAFLWFTEDTNSILSEDKIVKEAFIKCSKLDPDELINIIISKDTSGNLNNNFVYRGKSNKELLLDN